MATKIFKEGSKWNIANHLVDAGTVYGVLNKDNAYLAIKFYGTNLQLCYGSVTTFENENGVQYTSSELLALLDEIMVKTDSESAEALSQNAVIVSASLTRPADTNNYTANDAVNSATVAVKQKETMTISGAIAVKQKNTITLSGTAPVKQKQTITLTGTEGTADIGYSFVTFEATFDTDLATTASNFVTANATSFLGFGIVLTSDSADLILESETAGTPFDEMTITNTDGDLDGTSESTTANVVVGHAAIGLPGNLVFIQEFVTSLNATAAAYKTAHEAAFLAIGIVLTNSTNTLVFEAQTAGVAFEAPTIVNIDGDLDGTVVETVANVVAGQASISCNGVTKSSTFATNATTTAAAFVTANSADFSAAGVTLTSSGADLIFESATAGTAITVPTLTQTDGTYAGSVAHTTANASISAIEIPNFAKTNGGGGYISDIIIETDATQFASTTQRLWLFNALPSGSVGDNVAFVNNWANRTKRIGYVDVEMGALLAGSDSIIGQVTTYILFDCTTSSTSLFLLHQTLSAVTSPKSAGAFNYTFKVLQI